MKRIDPAGFERKFSESIDPWNYRTSRFEAYKRKTLLRACGGGKRGRGLELACAIGETSRALTPLCLRLLAVDSSRTALDEARRRHGGDARLRFRRAVLPTETPRGPFDVIVVSELAYYLVPNDLRILTNRLRAALAPGGRIVVLHHLRPFDDAAQLPALAHRGMRRAFGAGMRKTFDKRDARFDAVAYRKPRR